MVVLGNQLDEAGNIRVELSQVLGRDPVLEDRAATGLVDLVAVQEGPADAEAGDVPAAPTA